MSEDNPEVVKLASQVSEAKNEDIPTLLLSIESLLQQHREYSKNRQRLKQDILKYDLLSWCSVVLKYDFVKVKGGYSTAVKLIEILFECCIGIRVEDSEEFSKVTLPEALQSALMSAWHIQELYVEKAKSGNLKFTRNAEELETLKMQYESVLDSATSVMTSHPYLVNTFLQSDNLIRLLVEESDCAVNLTVSALNMLLRAIRVNHSAVKNMSTVSKNHLLDELIYKVTTSQNDDLAAVTVKIIVVMVDAEPEIANKLSVRFKGLKALMTRWLGHGFDHVLKNLIIILDAGNATIADLARRTHAVKTIWAAYKGWKTRTRVSKLHKVVPSLQSSFRRKRQEKLDQKLAEKFQFEREHAAELSRKRSMRSTREKQLQMLEIVPAKKISQHIQMEEEKAAVKVQSLWKGHMQRKQFSNQQYIFRASRAAIMIQRAVRRFLASRKRMRESKSKTFPSQAKLTKDRREELQLKIKQRQAVRGVKETSLAKAKEIHDKTQQKLLIYHTKRLRTTKFDEPKVQALLAKIHTEQELLQNIPNLTDCSLDDLTPLACSSTAVVMAAEKQHKQKMRDLTSPWWKKLSAKTGDNLDPFSEKIKPEMDADLLEIEEFLNPNIDRDILF